MGTVHSISRKCEAHDRRRSATIAQRPLRTVETPMQSSIPLLPVRVAPARSARKAGCRRAPLRARGWRRPTVLLPHGVVAESRRRRVQGGSTSARGSLSFCPWLLPASTHVASLAPRGQGLNSSVLEGQVRGYKACAHGLGRLAWYGIQAPTGTSPTPAGKQRVPYPSLFCDGSRRTAPSHRAPTHVRNDDGVGVVVFRGRPATPCINDARPGPASSRGRWNCLRSDGNRATTLQLRGPVRGPGRPVQAWWRAVRTSCSMA
jgi:hypothetical protein